MQQICDQAKTLNQCYKKCQIYVPISRYSNQYIIKFGQYYVKNMTLKPYAKKNFKPLD